MIRAIAALCPLLLASCALAPGAGRSPRDQACAERAYLDDGEIERALSCFEPAGKASRIAPAAAFLRGEVLDVAGRPSEALSWYSRAIEEADGDRGDEAPVVAAAMALVALRGRIDGFEEVFGDLLERMGDEGIDALPHEARHQIRTLELGLAMRSAEPAEVERLVEETGCLSRWRVSGPYGPGAWTRFDEPARRAVERSRSTLADLGPGRGISLSRRAPSNGCSVRAVSPDRPAPGYGEARTAISVAEAGTIHLRLETGAAARVLIGDEEVWTRDARTGWPARVAWFSASVPAGEHEILVRLADPESIPAFSLVALTSDGRSLAAGHDPDLAALGLPAEAIRDEGPRAQRSPAELLAALRVALWWDDHEEARSIVEEIGGADPSAPLLAALAEAEAIDRSLPSEIGFELSRALMQRALSEEPLLWQPRLHVARYEASEGREEKALGLLEEGIAAAPEEPEIRRAMLEVVAGLGWEAETEAAAEEYSRLLPTSCSALEWKLSIARRDSRFEEAMDLAERVSACDRSSPALAEELLRAQRYPEAIREARRLADRDPSSARAAKDVARARVAAGEIDGAAAGYLRSLEIGADDREARVAAADGLLAAGKDDEAEALLERGIALLEGPWPALLSALARVEDRRLLGAVRVDGEAAISEYRERPTTYDAAAVWVLDRAVNLVSGDGSRIELVHSIAHLRTDEAVEEHGEIDLPGGALLLAARTHKPDGRVLSPEEIAGKPTVSLPGLAPGDFVEVEHVRFHSPNPIFPGGFDTGRFYFQDFSTAFHRSEIAVVLPADMPFDEIPRGECPAREERVAGGLRALIWRASALSPRTLEPASPVATEHLPSIRVTSAGGWESLLSRMRELLADRDRPSRHLDDVLREATAGVGADDRAGRRRALLRWVTERVEENGDLFDQAGHVVVREEGSRARALAALLRAAGHDARLALTRPLGADATPTAIPALDVLDRPILLVDGEDWVDPSIDGGAWGFVPPDLRGAEAVLVDTGERVRIGNGTVPRDRQEITLSLTLDRGGDARGEVREEIVGALAAEWRGQLREIPPAELERRFQESYLARAIPGAALESLGFEGADDPERELCISYSLEIPGLARAEGGRLAIDLPFSLEIVKGVGALPARRTPVVFPARLERTVSAEVSLPEGFRVVSAPESSTAKSEWGRAELRAGSETGALRFATSASLDIGRVPPGRYGDFLAFARAVDRITRVEVSLTRGEDE